MDEEQYQKRLEELRGQTADISFSPEIYDRLRRLLAAVQKNLDEIDPHILDLDDARLTALVQALPPVAPAGDVAMRRLSHLDMFDLERIALTAEGYFTDLGSAEALGMSPTDLTSLTETLGQMRKSCFAPLKKEAGA